jgi:osmoprotectant transport system ATP-binding protein
VIRLTRVTKRFPGPAAPAVDALSLDVGAGRICVLIGPSGCGKTTTMRMINRLIEPTSGRIEVDGRDVSRIGAVELRRRIGYVIQQVGLFPHMTIAENVATVPRLLGWPAARTRARVDELLALVGLDPAIYRARYPRELSGGQRQRVGVARALAGDPPVMLMDEPFAAVDPITRARLQTEFLKILRALRKTIVFVTHDVDEAIRMGDRIAIMRDGRLVQHGTPAEILARPADSFVDQFVGSDRALKRLGLVTVRDVMRAAEGGETGDALPADMPAREAVSALLTCGRGSLPVVDGSTRVVGRVSLDDMKEALRGGARPDLDERPGERPRDPTPED